ncbi:MAG TPA: UbiD family decarboxylase [Thermodesulfobacteriota bacterium]|nr:UbiD family decarboxylase [Thermodesulfobacteriota bacterium]
MKGSVAYRDLREWVAAVEAMGELVRLRGISWDKEMGAFVEMCVRQQASRAPAFLFDEIPGYPPGYRCLYGMLASPRRFAFSMGMAVDDRLDTQAYLRAYRQRIRDIQPIPPRVVERGPILQNVREGRAVDLLEFPVPIHHELDGGRYIGTADAVITRDPDEGWVNVGTYRMQVFEKDLTGLYISPGKHGRLQMDKYLKAGKPCPVVAVVGLDPLLFVAARSTIGYGLSELDYAGGVRGEPLEVILGKETGLPIPANAEIALEGEVLPGVRRLEGPFGEWPGYYAGGVKEEPVVRVKRIYFRDDPILTCAASFKPPHAHLFERCFIRSAILWDALERANVPNVTGVWVHEAGAGRTFNVVAIKTSYCGHSRQAGILATQLAPTSYGGKWVIVVDDDIDPSNMYEVLWAMGTRCDPATDIEIIRKNWSSKIDPVNLTETYYNSRAMVDATIPFETKERAAKVAVTSPELRRTMLEKYGHLFEQVLGGQRPVAAAGAPLGAGR